MTRLVRFALTAVLISLPSLQWVWADETAPKPNVVLIYIDDLGYGDIGPYGCEDIPTPTSTGLRPKGCVARRPTSPTPRAARAAAHSSWPVWAALREVRHVAGLPIPADRPTLAAFLRDNATSPARSGSGTSGRSGRGLWRWASPRWPGPREEVLPGGGKNGKGSKYFCVDEDGRTMWLTDYDGDRMVEFIERHRDRPFFLYWSPEAVHSSNKEAPDRLKDRTTAEGKRRPLAGAIVSVDDQVGKLLEALEAHGLRDDTLVIFSSDNGANGSEGGSSAPYTGGKGSGTQKEGWVRVPTIFSMPGTLPEGKDYHGLMANFDFYSTIAARAGLAIPAHCDGVDLVPFLTGEQSGDPHEYLFWLNNEPGDAVRRHLIAVRWKDWRLYRKYAKDPWQLFDLVKDPREENDLAARHPEVVTRLAKRHAEWSETLAPLGELPKTPAPDPAGLRGHGWVRAAGN